MTAPAEQLTTLPQPILDTTLERCIGLPPLLSVGQAADVLGLSRSAAYRAVDRGDLPTIRLAGRIRVPLIQLLVLIGIPLPTEPAPTAATN